MYFFSNASSSCTEKEFKTEWHTVWLSILLEDDHPKLRNRGKKLTQYTMIDSKAYLNSTGLKNKNLDCVNCELNLPFFLNLWMIYKNLYAQLRIGQVHA